MKKSTGVLVLALALLVPGCVYGNFGRPLDTDLDQTTLGTRRAESGNTSYCACPVARSYGSAKTVCGFPTDGEGCSTIVADIIRRSVPLPAR